MYNNENLSLENTLTVNHEEKRLQNKLLLLLHIAGLNIGNNLRLLAL